MRAIMEEIDVGRVFASNAHATRRRRRLSTARRGCDASTRFSLSLFTRFLPRQRLSTRLHRIRRRIRTTVRVENRDGTTDRWGGSARAECDGDRAFVAHFDDDNHWTTRARD
jgi:hypothetical protein